MKVSPTFNSLVAPNLYRSVTIESSTRVFFASPRMSEELVQSRKTEDKAFNLTYVEEVTYSYHERRRCTPASRIKEWSSFRLRPHVLRMINPLSENDIAFDINNPCCDCRTRIFPTKLVWLDDPPMLLSWYIDFTVSLSSLV
jgi:hypothetical protein